MTCMMWVRNCWYLNLISVIGDVSQKLLILAFDICGVCCEAEAVDTGIGFVWCVMDVSLPFSFFSLVCIIHNESLTLLVFFQTCVMSIWLCRCFPSTSKIRNVNISLFMLPLDVFDLGYGFESVHTCFDLVCCVMWNWPIFYSNFWTSYAGKSDFAPGRSFSEELLSSLCDPSVD